MPPQQPGGLLDLGDDGFDFRAHDDVPADDLMLWGCKRNARPTVQYKPPVPVRTAPAAESGETESAPPLPADSAPMTE